MSVEGMWALFSSDNAAPNDVASSIVVLESGRVFGGDSAIAILGNYTVDRGIVEAAVRTWSYNPTHDQVVNVFGSTVEYKETRFRGTIQGDEISGFIWEVAQPHQRLITLLKKVADLP